MAQSINLQIIPNGVLPKVYASQFDVGREVQFNLFDGASAYTPPAGTAIRFEGKKSDGTGFSYACTNVGNVVTVELTDQMTVFAEEIPCEIRMALNGDDIGTLNVILCVEKSPIDAGVPISDTEIPAIIDLARQEQYTAEAWAKGTRNGVPVTPGDPTYNNNSEYWAGQSQAATQGALKYKGSCLFANIPTTGLNQGDMWNIEDDFTTDNRFQEGSGIPVKAGSNIAWNSNSKWDVLAMQKIYSLSDLTDTVISSPTDGEVLTYDNVAGKWENKPISVSSIDADDVVYDNSASGLTATDAQAALDEIAGDVTDKHTVTNKQVDLTSWTTDTTSQSGTTLYKKQITLNHVYVDSPTVEVGAASGYVLPTTAEQDSFDLLEYVTVDSAVPCLYLYASAIPTTVFYINVEGVD